MSFSEGITPRRQALALCCLTLLFFTALDAAPVHAAVVVTFDPKEATPTALVRAKSDSSSMESIRTGRFRLFLAPSQRVADNARSPEDPRLIRLPLVSKGRVLKFRIPRVSPGRYIVVSHCKKCIAGGSLLPRESFESFR